LPELIIAATPGARCRESTMRSKRIAFADYFKHREFVVPAACFIIAFCLLEFLEITPDNISLAVLFAIPFLVWLVISNRLSEFTLPGGIAVKLLEKGDERITPIPFDNPVETARTMHRMEKGLISKLPDVARDLPRDTRVAITLNKDAGDFYSSSAVAQYIKTFRIYDRDCIVVVIDKGGKFVGSTPGDSLQNYMELASEPSSGQTFRKPFQQVMKSGERADWLDIPSFTDESIPTTATNSEALEKLNKLRRSYLVAVDAQDRPVGLIDRNLLLSKLFEQLMSPKKAR
jgi:CBS domain-containing protein